MSRCRLAAYDRSASELRAGATRARNALPAVAASLPALQHLELLVESSKFVEPSHDDTFALLPQLRSLAVREVNNHSGVRVAIDFCAMLDSCPHLTSLRVERLLRFGIEQLLDIACHSTLDDVPLANDHFVVDQSEQLDCFGLGFRFSSNDRGRCDDEQAIGEQYMAKLGEEDEMISDDMDGAVWRLLHARLTRTQPTRRSCEVRLMLADRLHERVRGDGWWHVLQLRQSTAELRFCRKRVTMVRTILRQQLSALVAEANMAAAASAGAPLPHLPAVELNRPSRHIRVDTDGLDERALVLCRDGGRAEACRALRQCGLHAHPCTCRLERGTFQIYSTHKQLAATTATAH